MKTPSEVAEEMTKIYIPSNVNFFASGKAGQKIMYNIMVDAIIQAILADRAELFKEIENHLPIMSEIPSFKWLKKQAGVED